MIIDNPIVSGSLTVQNNVTASNGLFTGNQTISGSLFVSGGTELGGDLVPKISQGATLGTSERPFRELFLQSGSISIESDTPGDPSATISNNNGNLDISVGGMRLVQPGNSFIAETGSFQFISGSMSQIGDYIRLGDTITTGSVSVTNSITSSKVLINSIVFDTDADIEVGVGELAWNGSDGTLELGLKYGDVVLQLGQEQHFIVRNATGTTIENGTAVYASGLTGGSGRIEASPFTADGNVREVRFLGLATHDITNGVNGIVTQFGYVRELDTRGTAETPISVGDEDWSEGDILYAHPTVPGKLTNVPPKHKIYVAMVTTRHQNTGVLFVRPFSYGHMDDIHDVLINTGSLSTGDLLVYYDSDNENWINTRTLSGSYTISNGGLTANSFTGSLLGTASYADNADLLDGLNSSQFLRNDQSGTVAGDLTVTGIITAQEFHTEFVSASIIYESGSTKFGNTSDDRHEFTGSVFVSNGITGALTGNASTATTLQTARTIGGVSFDGSANINLPGVDTTGNQNTSGNAATATSASYAATGPFLSSYTETDTLDSVLTRGATTDLGFVIENGNSTYTTPSSTNVPVIYMHNTGAEATAHSVLSLRTLGGTGGDPFVSFDLNGVTGWSVGADNSDSDKFKISNAWAALESNTRLTIQTTGEVGIGTTSPNYPLHVNGNLLVQGTNNNALFHDGADDNNWFSQLKPDGTEVGRLGWDGFSTSTAYYTGFALQTRGTGDSGLVNRMVINSAGSRTSFFNTSVGIRVESDYANLTVSAANHQGFAVTRTGNNVPALFLGNDGGNTPRIAANNADLQIGRDLSDTFTTYITVQNDTGNVGIGTTNPVTDLHVDGSSGAPASSGTTHNGMMRLHARNGASGNGEALDIGFNISPSYAWLQPANAGNLSINYNLALNPNGGNVGIGSTTPGQKLDVNGTGKFGAYALIGTSIAAGYYQDDSNGAYRALANDGNRGYYYQSYNGGSTTMFVGLYGTYAGRVGIGSGSTTPGYILQVGGSFGATSITETSALRFKKNIVPLESQLDNIIKLNPVTFDWKEDDKHDIGFIAEEVEEVLPDLVSYVEDKVQGLHYTKFTAVLVKAIQEQQKQIEELRKEISILKESK